MNPKRISRRSLLKIVGLSAAVAASWQVGSSMPLPGGDAGLIETSTTRLLMGTVVNLTLIGEDSTATNAAVSATLDRMAALEALLSRHRSDSQLARLNATGFLAAADQSLLDLLRLAGQISEQSGGAFDITIKPLLDLYQRQHAEHALPDAAAIRAALALVDYRKIDVSGARVSLAKPGMSLTLDGIGKGYIVDAGVAILREHGFANVLVEAGGDLAASGQTADVIPWRIGIQSPRATDHSLIAKLDIQNQAAATSGDYMQPFSADLRQHHILDPRTGYSAAELASATVIAPTAALADGLATAAMVLGPRAARNLVKQWPQCEAHFVTKDLQMTTT